MAHQVLSDELINSKEEQKQTVNQNLFFRTIKWLIVALLILQVILVGFSLLFDINSDALLMPVLMIYFIFFVIRSAYIYDKTKEKRKLVDVIIYFVSWCLISFGSLSLFGRIF